MSLDNSTLIAGQVTTERMSAAETSPALAFDSGSLSIGADFRLKSGWGDDVLWQDFTIDSGKAIHVGGTTTVEATGSLTVDGGTFSTGVLIETGGFEFKRGTLNLTNSDLRIGSGQLFGQTVQFADDQSVNVTNSTVVEADGLLVVRNDSLSSSNVQNDGEIILDGFLARLSGNTFANNSTLRGNGRIDATLTNGVTGVIRAQTGQTLRVTGTGNANSGDIDLFGGTVEFTEDLTNEATGRVSGGGILITGSLSNAGTLQFSAQTSILGDVDNVAGGTIIVSGGSTTTFFDPVVHNGAEIRVSAGSQAVYFDVVSGAGSFTGTGLNFFEGGYSPGNSPALVTHEGSIGFDSGSSLLIELAGLSPGDEHDALAVGGTATLAGLLEVDLLDGFSPTAGDSFDILTAATIIGEFDALSLPAVQGIQWQLQSLFDLDGTTDVLRLTAIGAVPVPASAWLFGSALLLLGWARRRRHTGAAH